MTTRPERRRTARETAKWLVALTCENMAMEGSVVDKATRRQMVARTVRELAGRRRGHNK